MDIGTISRRYATALYRYARKYGKEKCIYKETSVLAANLRQYPALKRALASPVLSADKKEKAVYLATGGMVSKHFRNFIRFVIQQRRESFLQMICLGYQDIYRSENGLLQVDIVAAVPLTKAIEKQLIGKLERQTHKKVDITITVNPLIMGGYLVYWDTYRWDASVKRRLNHLRNELINNVKIN